MPLDNHGISVQVLLAPSPLLQTAPLDSMSSTHRDHFVPKSALRAPAPSPSRLTRALPTPQKLTSTFRDHFPEHGAALGSSDTLRPPRAQLRSLPSYATTEHRDQFVPVRGFVCLVGCWCFLRFSVSCQRVHNQLSGDSMALFVTKKIGCPITFRTKK